MPAPVIPPDFEADVRFLSEAEGGRKGPPIQGVYRPDISYHDDKANQLFMVWPWFIDESGRELPEGTTIPHDTRARFYIANDELRRTIHRQRIREGVQFYISEGPKRVAVCRVTKILNLHKDAA